MRFEVDAVMKYAVESFRKCVPEIKTLINSHYEELALNKDKVPLKPRWDVYDIVENCGKLVFITVRNDEGTLVGYSIGLMDFELHYAETKGYQMDILYIRQDCRVTLAGCGLLDFLEEYLKENKVDRVVLRSKVHFDITPLFVRKGYKMIETCWTKWIGA